MQNLILHTIKYTLCHYYYIQNLIKIYIFYVLYKKSGLIVFIFLIGLLSETLIGIFIQFKKMHKTKKFH